MRLNLKRFDELVAVAPNFGAVAFAWYLQDAGTANYVCVHFVSGVKVVAESPEDLPSVTDVTNAYPTAFEGELGRQAGSGDLYHAASLGTLVKAKELFGEATFAVYAKSGATLLSAAVQFTTGKYAFYAGAYPALVADFLVEFPSALEITQPYSQIMLDT